MNEDLKDLLICYLALSVTGLIMVSAFIVIAILGMKFFGISEL